MISLEHIHKYYNPGTVHELCLFEDFSLTIEKGQFVSIVGSNGSGKTSLIKIFTGLINDYTGDVFIDGHRPGVITKAKLGKLKGELKKLVNTDEDSICIYEFESLKYTSKEKIGVDNTEKIRRGVLFNLSALVERKDKSVNLALSDNGRVYFYDKKFHIDSCPLSINDSEIFIDFLASLRSNYLKRQKDSRYICRTRRRSLGRASLNKL
mgnify:CR=1 FL=1